MTAFLCTGNGPEHCCFVKGEECPYLEEDTVPGRRWACGLRRQVGSWEGVSRDRRYQAIGGYWRSIGQPFNYCETFQPTEGVCCGDTS